MNVTKSRIKNIRKEVLSDNWYNLSKYTYESQKRMESGKLRFASRMTVEMELLSCCITNRKEQLFLPNNSECLPT
jgi:hypothetical protein